MDKRQIGLAASGHEPACILGIEFAPHLLDPVAREGKGARRQNIDEVGQGEIDRNAACAGRFDGIHRESHDLARRRYRVRPDQFRPKLQALARGVELVGSDRSNIAGIAEPQRARRLREAGGGDPADLRRHVAAQGERTQALRIDEAKQAPRFHPVHPPRQRAFEFDEGRPHAVVAMAVHGLQRGAHGVGRPARLGWQTVF